MYPSALNLHSSLPPKIAVRIWCSPFPLDCFQRNDAEFADAVACNVAVQPECLWTFSGSLACFDACCRRDMAFEAVKGCHIRLPNVHEPFWHPVPGVTMEYCIDHPLLSPLGKWSAELAHSADDQSGRSREEFAVDCLECVCIPPMLMTRKRRAIGRSGLVELVHAAMIAGHASLCILIKLFCQARGQALTRQQCIDVYCQCAHPWYEMLEALPPQRVESKPSCSKLAGREFFNTRFSCITLYIRAVWR